MHSFPFRLVSLIWHPFLNLLLSLFNVFFLVLFSTSRFRWDFSVTSWFVSSQFCVCFIFFVKIFPRPFAELSPVIVLFFFVMFVCLFSFFFTVSTSSMALFAQHQSLLFSISWLRVCVWVRIFFPPFPYSTVSHSICFSVYCLP